jgi:hypothetical protein
MSWRVMMSLKATKSNCAIHIPGSQRLAVKSGGSGSADGVLFQYSFGDELFKGDF